MRRERARERERREREERTREKYGVSERDTKNVSQIIRALVVLPYSG